MPKKELFKILIALTQAELPFERIEREIVLPVRPDGIITIPGVRRAGKSSLLMLVANKLVVSGVNPKQILWINFDDERLAGMQAEELDQVLSAYREMFPDVDLKDVYMFFDEIQRIDAWEDAINSMRVDFDCDIYVTGSNA